MDICKWLDETVLPRQPPSPPVDCHASRLQRTAQLVSERQKRKQTSSDSSLLQGPLQPSEKIVLPGRGGPVKETADKRAHTDASRLTVHSGSSVSSCPYRRRPRRKTRPERYEPVAHDAEERGTHNHKHKRSERRRARRATRRSKAEKPGSGIVQNFQAKNVPRDRLTLKPREKLGLFSKGRVSSPVKVRGLPDLVFSEMKFLQKNKGQPEADLQAGSSRKKRKNDHAYAKEEDISAYFTSVQPTLAEQDWNIQAKDKSRQKLRESECAQREYSPILKHAIPTVETEDNTPYSRLQQTEPSDKSESYISWSESVLAPSVTPARLRSGTVREACQPNSRLSSQEAGNLDGGGLLHSRLAHITVTKSLTGDSGERFQVSSLPPTNERVSRSHSLPQQASSPRHINHVDRETRHRAAGIIASPSPSPLEVMNAGNSRSEHVHQSHILDIPEMKDNRAEIRVPDSLRRQHTGYTRETEQRARKKATRQRSSSLGRILQDCSTVLHDSRKEEALRPIVQKSLPMVPEQNAARSNDTLYPVIRELSTVQFPGYNEPPCPSVPMTYGPSIYERQIQRQYRTPDLIVQPIDSLPPPSRTQDQCFNGEELDYSGAAWDEEIDLQGYGAVSLACDETRARVWDGDLAQELQSGSKAAVKPGFWRPHKLY